MIFGFQFRQPEAGWVRVSEFGLLFLKGRLLKAIAKYFGRLSWTATKHWNHINGSLLAAGVSFYACLSVFPIILILLSAFGFFLQYTGYTNNYEKQILKYLSDQTSSEMSDQIHALMTQIETDAAIGGPIGLVFLLMLALALFVNFERAFSLIWDDPADDSKGLLGGVIDVVLHRFRAFVMLLGIAILILLNFFSHIAIDVVAEVMGKWKTVSFMNQTQLSHGSWRLVHLFASVSLNALLFTTIYEALPKKKVAWRHAFLGGVVASFSWEIGRYVLAYFVITDKYHAFGVVGVFMALLLWTYYGSNVILFGGVLTKVSRQIHQNGKKIQETKKEALESETEQTSEVESEPDVELTPEDEEQDDKKTADQTQES